MQLFNILHIIIIINFDNGQKEKLLRLISTHDYGKSWRVDGDFIRIKKKRATIRFFLT